MSKAIGQPKWKYIGHIGDADPTQGQSRIYIDETGLYDPEIEVIEPDSGFTFDVHRVILEKLEDPEREWFDLAAIANWTGQEKEDLVKTLKGESDIYGLAQVYTDIGRYYGFANFGDYSITLSENGLHDRYSKD